MEFSHLFILQLQHLPCSPARPTLLMTRTSWSVLTLSFCSISWLSFIPQLHPSIRQCNLGPQVFRGAGIQSLLLSSYSSSKSPPDLPIASGPKRNYPSNYVSASDLIRIHIDLLHGRGFVTCHHRCRTTARSWCYVRESGPAAFSWLFSLSLPSSLQQWLSVVVQDNLCLILPLSGRRWSANCPSLWLRDDMGLLVGWELLIRWDRMRRFGVWDEFMDL